MPTAGRPRVFLSYSHDSEEHSARVLGFANRLIGDGLDCIIDQHEPHPAEGWPLWMDRQLDEADFVLVICTEGYYRKAKAGPRPSTGKGVKFECVLILSDLYSAGMWNETFIPVLFQDLPDKSILRPLRDYTRYRVDQPRGYEDLLRHLTDQPRHPRPLPGPLRRLPLQEPRLAGDLPNTSGVSVVPAPPPHYLPRPQDLKVLKSKLLASSTARLGITAHQKVGVQGMGGVGKSVIAAALASDPEVQATFPGGIFWVAVGQQPDLVRLQLELAAAAGETNLVLESTHQGKLTLSRLLREREILLVLDDVWELDSATTFDVVGPRSRLLVTTRNAEILVGLGAEEHNLDVLAPEQALVLLANWAGQPIEHLPPEARQVARRCGYLPLALAMIGAMVRLRPTGWADALERLERADLDKIRRNFPDYPYPDLLRALEVSVQALPPEERERYLELAALPKEAAVTEMALETLWAAAGLSALDTRDLAAKLVARSLAQRDRDGRLRLHDLQADYLRREAGDLRALHGRWVDSYAARCPDGFHCGPNDGYFFQRLAYHLARAGRTDDLRGLLLDFRWFDAKLAVSDINALLTDFDTLPPDPEVYLIQAALRLSSHTLIRHPEELPGQLVGRLRGRTEPGIVRLLGETRTHALHPWLNPLAPSLAPAGGPLVRVFEGHSAPVYALAVLPDGRLISTSFETLTLRIWDIASGQTIRTFEGHSGWVCAVALLLDGRVVSADRNRNTLCVWDSSSGQKIRTLEGHRGAVQALAVLPDGCVISASQDRTLRVWDLTSGQTLRTLEGHSDWVQSVAVLPDGRIVSASRDRSLRIWDLTSGQTARILEGHSGEVNAVSVLPDGRIISASDDRTLRVWDLASGQTIRILEGHSGWVSAVAALPDGHIVSTSNDRTLRVWDPTSGQTVRTLEGHWGGVGVVAVLPDGRIVSASNDQTLRLWDLASDPTPTTLGGTSSAVLAVAVLADNCVVSASSDGGLCVWDLASVSTVMTLEGDSYWVSAMAVLPDNRVVSASRNCMRVWSLATGRTVRILEGHSDYDYVTSVAVLPDCRVVSASGYILHIWDLATGQAVNSLRGHWDKVNGVAVLPDGRIISASGDRTLRVWDPASGRSVRTLQGHSDAVTAVAVLTDGHVVSASIDRTLRLWNLASGQTVRVIDGLSDRVSAVAVLSGDRIVSAFNDHTLRIWDLTSGTQLARLTLDARPLCLAVLPDLNEVVVGDQSGHLHYLRFETGNPR